MKKQPDQIDLPLNFDWADITPPHNCKLHLKVISQTHSVNSIRNIVVTQTKQCKICGRKFEESNPGGIK